MSGDIGQLGKYRILAEIGKGGFATVYRALDTSLDREVALKVLDPLLARDPAWVARFQREAKAVARLKHPHIVTIHEIGESEGRIYIAMELIEGPSLAQWIAKRGRLPWNEALAILSQVAAALDYAHGQGVLHRDLKPANILLDPQRGAVLTDFGFARLVGESSMSVSLSGGVVGTPAYIAPEVWDGEEPSAQTDLYSLACVACEMLTGEALFAGKTPSVVMRQHLMDGPRWPDAWPAGIPDSAGPLLRQALSRRPYERPISAGKFVASLMMAQPSATGPEPAASPLLAAERHEPSPPPPPGPKSAAMPYESQRQRRRLGWLLAALILALVVVGAWVLSIFIEAQQTPGEMARAVARYLSSKSATSAPAIAVEGQGALIMEVVADSPAAAAGLKLYDIIIQIDETLIDRTHQLADVITAHKPGDQVEIKVKRGGQKITVTATLGSHPENSQTAYLGVRYSDLSITPTPAQPGG